MNQAQRQERQFDEAAEQAKADGTSSLGIGFDRKSAKELKKFYAAAEARDCTFSVDEDGAGIFTFDFTSDY